MKSIKQKIKKTRSEKGFTLIEVVMGLGIVLTVIAALIGIQIMVRNSYRFTFNTAVSVDHANSVAQEIVQELRGARTGDNGAYALEIVGDQELAFYADVDSDPETERVRYFVQGNTLNRGVIDPEGFPVTYPLASEKVRELTDLLQNDTDPIYYYYNEDWPFDVTGNPLVLGDRLSRAKFIQVSLITNADADRPQGDYELVPYVQLRNLKNTL